MWTSQGAATEPVLRDKEIVECLGKAIHDLPEEEKQVFLLRQNGALTYEQIAVVRHCPLCTVKMRMRSALRKLRKHLV
jgi:RNA polymerase sigma-70 factor (ECF subfamily)